MLKPEPSGLQIRGSRIGRLEGARLLLGYARAASRAESEGSTTSGRIDALLEGGEPVEEGSPILDPAESAARMRASFRHADRSRYLIAIVEALHALDATRVVLSGEGVDFTVQASAVDLPEPSRTLLELYGFALEDTDTPLTQALARLAVGVDMGLGHGSIERIVISYGTGRETILAEFREGLPPTVVRAPAGPAGCLRVFVDRPWSSTRAHDGTAARELDHLRRAVRYSRRPVLFDGALASQQPRELWGERRGQGRGYRYVIGLEQAGEQPSEIEIWSAGVQIDRIEGEGVAVRAALHLDAPHRGGSQMRVVRDAVLEGALAQLEAEREALLDELARADAGWTHLRPQAWPESRVDRVLGRPLRVPRSALERGERGGVLVGALLYAVGIVAGAAGVGTAWGGELAGLLGALIFLIHGTIGAKQLASWRGADRERRAQLLRWLVGLAAILALLGGLAGHFILYRRLG